MMNHLFQELILISLGHQTGFGRSLSEREWKELYWLAKKQSLTGVLLTGVEKYLNQRPEGEPVPDVLYQWIGKTMAIETENAHLDKRAADLTRIFADNGFRTCVLKGQGVARLYPKPERRHCGDIDLWVEDQADRQKRKGGRDRVLAFLRSKDFGVGRTVVHHVDAEIFKDTSTEIHFIPSFSYDPLRYRRYLKLFAEESAAQYDNYDQELGFAFPTRRFNAVYSLMHIFRHVFHEGIGLRQLLDYYYILKSLSAEERQWAAEKVKWLGLRGFAGAVMYVQRMVFRLDDTQLLFPPDEEAGRFLLEEVMTAGNFGQHDARVVKAHSGGTLKLYLLNVKRLWSMLRYYPSEVLWAPIWKPVHWIWRKINGYV